MLEEVVPAPLKTAIFTPIYKSRDKEEVDIYQPISVLPVISKVYEKVAAEHLMQYLEDNTIFDPLHIGFRRNYLTETAFCYFLEEIKYSPDQGGVLGAVFPTCERHLTQ